MNDVIPTLNAAMIQFWPKARLLDRYRNGSDAPASYWYLPIPGELDMIRIFPIWDKGSFYLSCFRSPDQETLDMFTRELHSFGSDMLMLPYSLQNMEVDFTGNDFIISKVGTISTHNTTLFANSSQLIFYTANGFRENMVC